MAYKYPPPESGYWEPLTNGDPATPELIFLDGDVIMMWVDA